MRARDFLLEYDRNKTFRAFRDRIIDRYEEQAERLGLSPVYQPENAIREVIDCMEDADPTKKKAFTLDLLNWWLRGEMRFIEDASKATPGLELYAKFKNRGLPTLKSITFSQFLDLADELANTSSKSDTSKAEEKGFYDRGEARLERETEDYKIIIPRTEAAAKFFGRGTRWCTSAENNNMFARYNEDGPLFIILFKGQSKKWQFHFETEQLMDERDDELYAEDIRSEPELCNWFFCNVIYPRFETNFKQLARLLDFCSRPDDLPNDLKINLLKADAHAIQRFQKPNDAMIDQFFDRYYGQFGVDRLLTQLHLPERRRMERRGLERVGLAFYKKLSNPLPETTEMMDQITLDYIRNDAEKKKNIKMLMHALDRKLLTPAETMQCRMNLQSGHFV